ncbi:unnamed protein product [Calypogeia fissa]
MEFSNKAASGQDAVKLLSSKTISSKWLSKFFRNAKLADIVADPKMDEQQQQKPQITEQSPKVRRKSAPIAVNHFPAGAGFSRL